MNSMPLHRRLLQAAVHKSERRRTTSLSALASLSTLHNNHLYNKNATIITNNPSSTKNQHQSHNFFFSSLTLKQAPCPFRTLNIPKESKYSLAKKSFLKVAMKHHPDTLGTDCEETQQKSQAIFMKCRKALEALEECPDTGLAILKTEAELKRSMSNEEFDEWFEEETGLPSFQFDLDPKVMREVADMHEDMAGSHGLDRDGGMWHLASMISSAVKTGKGEGAESVLKLEAGAIRDEETVAVGTLSRRRKRTVRRR